MSFHRVSGRKSIFFPLKTHLRWAPSAEKPSVWYMHPQHLKGRIERGSCSTNNTCLPTWGDDTQSYSFMLFYVSVCGKSPYFYPQRDYIVPVYSANIRGVSAARWQVSLLWCLMEICKQTGDIWSMFWRLLVHFFSCLNYINNTTSRSMASQCESETRYPRQFN